MEGTNQPSSLLLGGGMGGMAEMMMAGGAGDGPHAKKITVEIGGNHTDIILTPFSNCIFVVITQLGKIGTLIQATKDAFGSGYDTETGHTITTLMGKRDDPVLALYARQLVELITQKSPTRSLLLGIALKDNSLPTMQAIMGHVEQNKVW